MKNPNNLITVNFPNGQSRRRNCMSTFVPADRMRIQHQFPAYGDFYSRVKYAGFENNRVKQHIEDFRQDNNKNDWDNTVIVILMALLLLAVGALIWL